MIQAVLETSNQNVKSRFSVMAKKYPALTLQGFEKVISHEFERLYRTKSEEDVICSRTWPGRLESARAFMPQFKEFIIPLLKKLLSHEWLSLRIYAAEVMFDLGDSSDQESWRRLLEIKSVVQQRPHFEASNLWNTSKLGEIPLVMGALKLQRSPSEMKFAEVSDYIFGLTDENMYIVPFILGPYSKGEAQIIPLSIINAIHFEDRPVGLTGKTQKVFEIHCVRVLTFDFGFGSDSTGINDENRLKKCVELFEIMKNSSLTKSEIFRTYFNKKNVSLD